MPSARASPSSWRAGSSTRSYERPSQTSPWRRVQLVELSHARPCERGIGWRIDYFLVSPQLMPKVTGTAILDNVFGSDHCPIELELEL